MTNLTQTVAAGLKLSGPCTVWTTGMDVTHPRAKVAGCDPQGNLMHFSNWPGDWVITHVTNYTGLKVRRAPMDSWVTRLGTTYVEHIAAVGLGGEVLVFSRPETGDWRASDLSASTVVKVATSAYRYAALGLAHWQTPSASGTTDHLVGVGPAGEVLVFSSVNGSAWQVVNVSALTGTSVASLPTPWVSYLSTGQVEEQLVVGAHVEAGQKIGSTDAFVSAPVHASVSGTVKAVEDRPNFTGAIVKSVVVAVDANQPTKWTEKKDVSGLSAEQIREIAREAGLVGMGGAAFPTHVKLAPPKDKPVDTVVINGCECEPFLTCDHRLMLERPDDLIAGLKLMMKAVGAERGIIGVEANKMDAADGLQAKVSGDPALEVALLEVKYPEGAEKMLIEAVTGRRVPPGKLPSEVSVLVQNVGTAVALFEAASSGKPLIERVLTVTGPGIKVPKNVKVKIGTPIEFVIEQCGGMVGTPGKVIMGGPMTGWAQKELAASVVKGTSGILVLTREAAAVGAEQQCVGCDKCLDVCPMFLTPNMIVRYARRGKWAEADRFGARDCFECGCCSYACPANIPHVAYVRKAKAEIAAMEKK